MKYAVIEIGGKQLLVEEGKYYAINRLPQKAGSSLVLQRVLLCNDKGRRFVGHPYIENLDLVKILLILDFSFSALPWIYIIKPMVDNRTINHYKNLRKNLTF